MSTSGGAPTDLNGHTIDGVKAQDVAAEHQPDVPLDPATRAVVAEQLMVARQTAMKYPTAADAEAAGYRLVAGFGPGSGAHYIGGPMTGSGPFDPTHAQSLIYAGTSPTSPIVGLMYFGLGETAPEGFAGPNDHWHRHSSVCTTFANGKIDVPFPPDHDVTQEQCTSVGGRYMQTTGWMVHAWVVPGWGEPVRRLLTREPEPPLCRRHLQHRQRWHVPGALETFGSLTTRDVVKRPIVATEEGPQAGTQRARGRAPVAQLGCEPLVLLRTPRNASAAPIRPALS